MFESKSKWVAIKQHSLVRASHKSHKMKQLWITNWISGFLFIEMNILWLVPVIDDVTPPLKSFHLGSGCGWVGRAAPSNTRGLRFESSHWHDFIINICTVNCWKDENKEKEVGNIPFSSFSKTVLNISFTILEHVKCLTFLWAFSMNWHEAIFHSFWC